MKSWHFAVLLQPLFIAAYAGLIAACIWLAQRLPDGWFKRLLLKRW
jgi:hypothetical protein